MLAPAQVARAGRCADTARAYALLPRAGPRVIGRLQPTFSHSDKCAADFIKILYTSTEGYEAPTFDSLDTDGDGACATRVPAA